MLSCRDMAPLLSTHSPTAPRGGRWCRKAPKGGDAFPSPAGRLYGFSHQRRHKKWRPKGRRTSPAQWYYITPEGESPQPVREASAGPGQNLGSPGPKGPAAGSTFTPVRACQPSGIQESTAPPTGIYREMIHYRRILRVFCIECASRPKLALSLPIKGPSF